MANLLYELLNKPLKLGNATNEKASAEILLNGHLLQYLHNDIVRVIHEGSTAQAFSRVYPLDKNTLNFNGLVTVSNNTYSNTTITYNKPFKLRGRKIWNAPLFLKSNTFYYHSLPPRSTNHIVTFHVGKKSILSNEEPVYNIKNVSGRNPFNTSLSFDSMKFKLDSDVVLKQGHSITLNITDSDFVKTKKLSETTSDTTTFNIVHTNVTNGTLNINALTGKSTYVNSVGGSLAAGNKLTLQNLNKILGANDFTFAVNRKSGINLTIDISYPLATGGNNDLQNKGDSNNNYSFENTEYVVDHAEKKSFFGFEELHSQASFGHHNSETYIKKENNSYTAYFPKNGMTSNGFLGLVPSNAIITFVETDDSTAPNITWSQGGLYTISVPNFREREDEVSIWQ